jgi:hypothetical protein
MLSKLLSCVAAVTIAAGMTAAAPAMAAAAASSVPRQTCVARGFLNDGSGQGSALSITPGVGPSAGEQFTQQNDSDAWEMCLHGDHTLQPESAPGWCAANNDGKVKLRTCDTTHGDQSWFVDPQSGGSFFLQNNFGGGFLCADGGVGSDDTVQAPVQSGGCNSFYHQTWEFIAG